MCVLRILLFGLLQTQIVIEIEDRLSFWIFLWLVLSAHLWLLLLIFSGPQLHNFLQNIRELYSIMFPTSLHLFLTQTVAVFRFRLASCLRWRIIHFFSFLPIFSLPFMHLILKLFPLPLLVVDLLIIHLSLLVQMPTLFLFLLPLQLKLHELVFELPKCNFLLIVVWLELHDFFFEFVFFLN